MWNNGAHFDNLVAHRVSYLSIKFCIVDGGMKVDFVGVHIHNDRPKYTGIYLAFYLATCSTKYTFLLMFIKKMKHLTHPIVEGVGLHSYNVRLICIELEKVIHFFTLTLITIFKEIFLLKNISNI